MNRAMHLNRVILAVFLNRQIFKYLLTYTNMKKVIILFIMSLMFFIYCLYHVAALSCPEGYTHYSQSDVCSKINEPNTIMIVECTTSAQCGSGRICDLSTMNYGKCITQKSNEEGIYNSSNSESSSTSYIDSLIVGICIITGLVIVALILRKVKNR